jgi:hypothetical protein
MPESSRNAIRELVKTTVDEDAEKTDGAEESSDEVSDADDMSEDSDTNDADDEIIMSSSSKLRNQVGQDRLTSDILDALPKESLPGPVDSLPMLFAPPAAIPYIVENLIDSKKVSLRFSPSAFLEGGQIGTTGAAIWNSDSALMIKEFDRVAAEISALEDTQNRFMRLVERSRTECARLLQQSSAIRLSTYTGKVRHRQNLGANSVSVPLTAVVSAPQPAVSAMKADASLLASLSQNTQSTGETNDERKVAEPVAGRKSSRTREVDALAADAQKITAAAPTSMPPLKGKYTPNIQLSFDVTILK